MKHLSIAWKLREVADLLALLGESHFKIRVYRKAAGQLEKLTEDIEKVWHEGRLTEIDGIGKSIAEVIEDILLTGGSLYLNELSARVSDLDNRSNQKKKQHLTTFQKAVFRENSLSSIGGGGSIRTIQNFSGSSNFLLKSLNLRNNNYVINSTLKDKRGRIIIDVALHLAHEIIARLKIVKGVEQVVIGGSLRRFDESLNGLTLVAGTCDVKELIKIFIRLPICREILKQDEGYAMILTRDGISVELFAVRPKHFTQKLVVATGSESHVQLLKKLGKEQGWKYNNYQWFDKRGDELVFSSEEELYHILGLKYIIPELRDGEEVILSAQTEKLPQSVELKQIKGDLNLKTRWSGGINSIEEMVIKAQTLGYEYIAICDHLKSYSRSRDLKGMAIEMLQEQLKEIDELNARFPKIRILKGIEIEILKDGSLGCPDELLAHLDLVIAGIYTGLNDAEEVLTQRMIAGMENPFVNIITYPTGRLLDQREKYSINFEQLIDAAENAGIVLEVNSRPNRFDLRSEYLKLCKAKGVKIVINSDAQSIKELEHMEYEVGFARRGWLEEADVLNTYSLERLLGFLESNR
ncbi:MAG: hypothetical protein KAX49_15030 [Halanaerobiales bacterium]|nr:hypothetical protein [Halanaerobiales bacterium]